MSLYVPYAAKKNRPKPSGHIAAEDVRIKAEGLKRKGVKRVEVNEKFIEDYKNLIHMVCKKIKPRIENNPVFDYDDIFSIGMLGLLKAAKKYNPEKGYEFSTYAVHLIWGEIMNQLREKGDSIRFPRAIKEDAVKIINANLLDEDEKVIMKKLNMSRKRVINAFSYIHRRTAASFSEVVHEQRGNAVTLGETVGIEIDFDTPIELELAFKHLTPKESRIIKLLNIGVSQGKIGNELGVSQAEISRSYRRALKKLKDILSEEPLQSA